MSTIPQPATPGEPRAVPKDVAWEEYTCPCGRCAAGGPFAGPGDRGVLEIMTPLFRHDNSGRFLGRLVTTATEELNLPIASGGSTTLRRRRRRRGLEPDECTGSPIQLRVRGRKRLNLRIDPPPDLAIEVDVTRSSLDRMSIYAQLNVPEVWRLDVPGLTFHVLQASGDYAVSATSRAFPWLTSADEAGFLSLLGQEEENAILRQFRAWTRQRQAGTASGTVIP